MRQLVRNNDLGKALNASSDISLEWLMENLCMQYLAVSFLRWVVTSCVMWGFPTCQSTPLCAARFPRVALLAAVDHPVHRAPLDRRAQVARQVLRVQAAPRDRAAAADHPDPAILLDPTEALAPPDKAAAQGPADTPDLVARLVAVDHPAQAARQAAPGRVAALARQVQVGPLVARVPRALLAHRAHPARLDPAVDHQVVPAALVPRARVVRPVHREVRADRDHQVAPAPQVVQAPVAQVVLAVHPVREHRAAAQVAVDLKAVPKADQVANRDPDRVRSPARGLDRSPVRKVVASLQALAPDHPAQVVAVLAQAAAVQADRFLVANHPVVAAMAAVLVRVVRAPDRGADPVRARLVSGPAELALAVLEARVNRTARAALAVARQAALVPLRRAVAVARATTSGMGSAGCRSRSPIRALLPWDRSKSSACAQGMSQRAPDLMWGRPFTQDASKVCNE